VARANRPIFISAGEFSGDLLAADLVPALGAVFPGSDFYGVTGPAMAVAGVQGVANISSFGVMGFAEVARKIGELAILEKSIFAAVERIDPGFVVTVDFPGFHFRLAEHCRQLGIPVYQYVAPKLWAWGAGRIGRLKQDFAGVLGILPFEREFFQQQGVRYQYVGSPHVDRMARIQVDREMFGLPSRSSGQRVVLLLPGSRVPEVMAIAPLLRRIAVTLEAMMPGVLFVVPVAGSLDPAFVASQFTGLQSVKIVPGASLELMSISDVAVVASGTATLECGLAELPMVVVYEMSAMSHAIARRVVTVKHASLVNLLAGEEVVPEFIQDVDAAEVAGRVKDLLVDAVVRSRQLQGIRLANSTLSGGAAAVAASWIRRWQGEQL
jgi:lipid-A-disaccharide synthase